MYRHPDTSARPFCNYLGEFLEAFAKRGTNLTLLGDIDIDLNKTNSASKEYFFFSKRLAQRAGSSTIRPPIN